MYWDFWRVAKYYMWTKKKWRDSYLPRIAMALTNKYCFRNQLLVLDPSYAFSTENGHFQWFLTAKHPFSSTTTRFYQINRVFDYLRSPVPVVEHPLAFSNPPSAVFSNKHPFLVIFVRKNPICLFVKISYRLVPISRGQADFNLLHNNKLKLGSISEWQADLDIFL